MTLNIAGDERRAASSGSYKSGRMLTERKDEEGLNIAVNTADLQYDQRYGPSLINGKQQGTVFGVDMVIGQENPAISGKWDMGIQLESLVSEFLTTGYIKITDGEETFELGTGIASDGFASSYSLKRVRYDPGTPLFMDYTVAFPKIEDSNGDYTCGIGFYDGEDAYLHAQRRREDQLEYGFLLIRGGIETFFPMNGNPMDLDYNDLNIFRMDGGYLGVAPTNIHLVDVDKEIFVRLHRQLYKQRVTSIKTPDLPVGAFVRNEGNTTNVTLLNGSFRAGTINGGQEDDPTSILNTYETAFSGAAGLNQTIFAFRNDMEVEMFDFLDVNGVPGTKVTKNTIASQLLEVKLTILDNNKIADVDLYILPSSDIISGAFTPVALGRSILKVSEDAVVDFTNAIKLDAFLLGKDDQNSNPVIETINLLFPGFTAIFTLSTLSVNYDFSAYIKYKDRY